MNHTIFRTDVSLKGVGLKRSQSATHPCPTHKGQWEAKEHDWFCGSCCFNCALERRSWFGTRLLVLFLLLPLLLNCDFLKYLQSFHISNNYYN